MVNTHKHTHIFDFMLLFRSGTHNGIVKYTCTYNTARPVACSLVCWCISACKLIWNACNVVIVIIIFLFFVSFRFVSKWAENSDFRWDNVNKSYLCHIADSMDVDVDIAMKSRCWIIMMAVYCDDGFDTLTETLGQNGFRLESEMRKKWSRSADRLAHWERDGE